jgi:hypothetical protein
MPFLNDIRNKAKRAPHPLGGERVSVRTGEGFHKIIEYADCFGEVV